jgi:hypothetical protein
MTNGRYGELVEKIERVLGQLKILREHKLCESEYPIEHSEYLTQTGQHSYLVGRPKPIKKKE